MTTEVPFEMLDLTIDTPLDQILAIYSAALEQRLQSIADGGVGGASTFLGLTDTPSSYVGYAGKVVAVNADANALTFVDRDGFPTFLSLQDTPGTYLGQNNYLVAVDEPLGKLKFIPNTAAPTTLLQLTDTPSSYAGQGGKLVAVKTDMSGVEFITPPVVTTPPTNFLALTDTPSSYAGQSGKYLTVSGNSITFTTFPALPIFPTTLVELSDFPSSMAGQAGRMLIVNPGSTALTFADVPAGGGGSGVAPIIVAVSPETATLTSGAAKLTFRAPKAMTLSKIKGSVTVASESGAVQVNVRKNGTTLFSTKLTIDATEKTSATAAVAAVLSTTAIAEDDELVIDVDNAGTNAVGLKVTFVPV